VTETAEPAIEVIPAARLAEVRPMLLELLAEDQVHYGGHTPDRTAIAGVVGDVAPTFTGENLLLGVRVDDALVAFCWLVFFDPGTGYEAEIAEVYVRPEHRGRGIARALVRRAVAVFRERGVTFGSVWTHPANEVAVRLYREAGFAPTEQLVLTWLPDGL
jgi:ribosomal protein S18 acetylase RimI-like enzyme